MNVLKDPHRGHSPSFKTLAFTFFFIAVDLIYKLGKLLAVDDSLLFESQ